ncbi:MAG: aldehyde dehydrogenase, partial [Chloroflexota bacterium]
MYAGDDVFESTDPATGELVAVLCASSQGDLEGAVAAAQGAFLSSAWAHDGALRARVLYGFAA